MADGNDPLSAALKRTFAPNTGSYFPAARQMLIAGERDDLLKDIDSTFYGGGQAPNPTPTPTPPVKPHQMSLAQLYDHFGVDNPFRMPNNFGRVNYQNNGGYYG